MKKIYFIAVFVLAIPSVGILAQEFYLKPPEKTVTPGSVVEFTVMFGSVSDSTHSVPATSEAVRDWRVNGVLGDQNLLVAPNYATYQVPDGMPEKNPIAISVDCIGGPNDRVTLISNIYVEDASNEITIDRIPHIINTGLNVEENKYSASNVRGQYVGNLTVVNLAGAGVNIGLTFPGQTTGTFAWNEQTAVGGSVDNQAYANLDPNTKKPSSGTIVVTEYGEIGKLIKGTFDGILWTQVGERLYSVHATGKFSVVHTK